MDQANTKLLSHIDCPGGGQVWVDGTILYVGHMRAPDGTTIIDIADPSAPRVLASIPIRTGWHSHKVRVVNSIMVINQESVGGSDGQGGVHIYDVSRPAHPTLLSRWLTGGRGVHRFDFDGQYAYISSTVEGYIGNIVVILDITDPCRPLEVGRWWMLGQWAAGGESYPWDDWVPPRCHHPLRQGDRLYVSYWHHGLVILDISDVSSPKLVSQFNTSPAFPHPTHTCLPMPQPIKGRNIMIVADEDCSELWPSPPAFSWTYDITNEKCPVPISTFQVPGLDSDSLPHSEMTGCHQPSERLNGNVVPFAWFAQGVRLVDFSDPFAPREVGYFIPEPAHGELCASSNDVTLDDRGLIYVVDRVRGVNIIESTVF